MDTPHPFTGLVGGRLATYFDEAFVEYAKGRIRGTYDYGMLALNSTLFELKPAGGSLFAKLRSLETDGKLGSEVVTFVESRDFLVRHDHGITDMDLSYMTVDELKDFLGFLERLYRSLAAHGVVLANDPRGN